MQAKNSKKKKYRVKNWSEYNKALINRGSIELFISPDAIKAWKARAEGKPGHPKKYSDNAIKTVLMIKAIFRMPLRQTQGFIQSIFNFGNIDLDVPDYSTISRRSGSIDIEIPKQNKEKIYAILDSTGLKIFGEGEWKTRKHGYSKRRTWKKLHISIDCDGEIRAVCLTGNDVDDAEMAEELTSEDRDIIEKFIGDGAYDKKKVYDLFEGVQLIIPPRENAVVGLHRDRDKIIREIRKNNITQWKKNNGYHTRSLVENAIFRFKSIFGDRLFSRKYENQRTETKIKCSVLNIMSKLGMPDSYVVN